MSLPEREGTPGALALMRLRPRVFELLGLLFELVKSPLGSTDPCGVEGGSSEGKYPLDLADLADLAG